MITVKYFDYNATTPMCPRAIETFLEAVECFGNPSSKHSLAIEAKDYLNTARRQVACLIGASADEVVFTSGGTESNNWAIKGAISRRLQQGEGRGHAIVSTIEHASILQVAEYLERVLGYDVTYVEPNRDGIVEPETVAAALRPDTRLVSVMLVNNEVGSIQPIKQIARLLKGLDIHFHVDGVQGVGKMHVDVHDLEVDTLSFSAHKFYGPKGIGGLYIRHGVDLEPLLHGGGQEKGLRGGTEAVGCIAAMGAAAQSTHESLPDIILKTTAFRNLMKALLIEKIPGCGFNGPQDSALQASNTLSLRIDGIRAEAVAAILDKKYGVQVSLGSACSNNKTVSLSHVLKAMRLSEEEIKGTLRISLGQFSQHEHVIYFVDALAEVVGLLRRVSRSVSHEAVTA